MQTKHCLEQYGREAEYVISRRNTKSAGGARAVFSNDMSSSALGAADRWNQPDESG